VTNKVNCFSTVAALVESYLNPVINCFLRGIGGAAVRVANWREVDLLE
jgi:hypothetical protein